MQLVRHVDSSIAMFENVVRPLRHPLGIVCCCLVVHTISAVILMPSIKKNQFVKILHYGVLWKINTAVSGNSVVSTAGAGNFLLER
jgi:hypothetical protein